MKTFGKIVGGFFLLLIVLIIGLNIYFTDERLRATVLPYLTDAVGQPVEAESMSLSFFSTFPHPGIEIDKLQVRGTSPDDTLLTLDRMVAGVELFPLFSSQVNVTELVLNRPRFTYIVYPDSTTNLDFFFDQPSDTTQAGGYNVDIPYFEVTDGHIGYRDMTSGTSATLDDLDGDLSLSYADSIASSVDLEVGGLSATIDSVGYVEGLPVSLTQKSVYHPGQERLRLQEGTLSLRGLALDLSGTLSNWSEAFTVDLQFNSSSDNFGELLRLVPETYADYTRSLETEGSLALGGTVRGPFTADTIPRFDIRIGVQDGYLKDPELPEAIRDIQLSTNATNDIVTIDTLNALAGPNSVTGSGVLNDPLADDGRFNLDFVADVDLSTVHEFYDITQMGVESLAGQLDIDANAEGTLDQPENAAFRGRAILADGRLKYAEVPRPITNINIDASGTQQQLDIRSLRLQAGQNSLSAEGQIRQLLDPASRRINMNTSLRFDLSTLKEFYPIDEDTLRMAGMLTAQATLSGRADQIERSVQSGSINLENGLIDYHEFEEPFRDITFESVLEGPRMTIVSGGFASGDNRVELAGTINDYLSEGRTVNLKTSGNAQLSQIGNYYELEPAVTRLDGTADFQLTVSGPLNDPSALAFSGSLNVSEAAMDGESLREPVRNLNGTFELTPQTATLRNLRFNMGGSDFDVSGSLSGYMQYLREEQERTAVPRLTGQYHSKYLNLDELIDWSDTTDTNFNLELPYLNGSLTARIDRMKITGVTMRNLQARATTTPDRIHMTQARVELFEGEATGTLQWDIPSGQPSTFHFQGALDSLRLESFFKEYPILGPNSQFYRYITGTFSSSVDYTTKIDPQLNPLLPTTVLDGTFGMSKARIENHPLQQRMASYTKINQLRDVALDQWQSTLAVRDNVLTINNLSLTSSDIGMELSGTQHLVTDAIDFRVTLLLPSRFRDRIASVITSQAADALTRDNGTIMVPLRITGNYSDPAIQPNQSVIKPIVQQYLKDKAGNTLRRLFGRDDEDDQSGAETDSARADSTQPAPLLPRQ